MPLHHLPSIVIAIFCLHNLCIIHGDAFDMDWAREAKMEMQRKWQTWNFSKKKRYIPHACNTIKQMKGLQTSTMITDNVEDNTLDSSDDEGVDKGAQSKNEI